MQSDCNFKLHPLAFVSITHKLSLNGSNGCQAHVDLRSHLILFLQALLPQVQFKSTIRASSAVSMDTRTKPSNTVMVDKEVNDIENILACSICYGPLTAVAGSGLSVESTNGYQLECGSCKKSFTGSETHLDLTIGSGIDHGESMPVSTEIYRWLK